MRRLLPLVLLGCFLFYSCNNNEEENYVEEIAMTNVFYEDFFDIDNINFVADSLYFTKVSQVNKYQLACL